MERVRHDSDLYLNISSAEMRNLVDKTFVISNEEVANIGREFSLFIEGLKDEILLKNISFSVGTVSEMVYNYTVYIQPAKERVSYNVGNISRLREEIVPACGQLPGQPCDAFLPGLGDVLADNVDEITLPELPRNLSLHISHLLSTLNSVDQQLPDIDLTGPLTTLTGQVERVSRDFRVVLVRLAEMQALAFTGRAGWLWSSGLLDIPAYWSSVNNVTLGLTVALSLLLGLLLFALTCGLCSGQGAASARRGASLLRCFFSLWFFLAFFLFIICAAMFLFGSISQKALCNSLEDPRDSQIMEFVDKISMKDINAALFPHASYTLSIVEIIEGIQNNEPLYSLFHLNFIFDVRNLDNWRLDYHIESYAENVRLAINTTVQDIVDEKDNITTTDILAEASNVDASLNPLIPDIMGIDLSLIGVNINQILSVLTTLPQGAEQLKMDLQRLIEQLRDLQTNTRTIQVNFEHILSSDLGAGSQLVLETFMVENFNVLDRAFDSIESDIPTYVNTTISDLLGSVDTEIPGIVAGLEREVRTDRLQHCYRAATAFLCPQLVTPCNSGETSHGGDSGHTITRLSLVCFSLVWSGPDSLNNSVPPSFSVLLFDEKFQTESTNIGNDGQAERDTE